MSLNDQLNKKVENLANREDEVVQTKDPLLVEATLLVARMIALTHDDHVFKTEKGTEDAFMRREVDLQFKHDNRRAMYSMARSLSMLPDLHSVHKVRSRLEHVVLMMAVVGAAFWFLALLTIAYYISGGVL